MTAFAAGAALLLGLLLVSAGALKLARPRAFQHALYRLLPARFDSVLLVRVGARAVGAAELVVGGCLLAVPWASNRFAVVPAAAGAVLYFAFVGVIAVAVRKGTACGCFSSFSDAVAGGAELGRSVALSATACALFAVELAARPVGWRWAALAWLAGLVAGVGLVAVVGGRLRPELDSAGHSGALRPMAPISPTPAAAAPGGSPTPAAAASGGSATPAAAASGGSATPAAAASGGSATPAAAAPGGSATPAAAAPGGSATPAAAASGGSGTPAAAAPGGSPGPGGDLQRRSRGRFAGLLIGRVTSRNASKPVRGLPLPRRQQVVIARAVRSSQSWATVSEWLGDRATRVRWSGAFAREEHASDGPRGRSGYFVLAPIRGPGLSLVATLRFEADDFFECVLLGSVDDNPVRATGPMVTSGDKPVFVSRDEAAASPAAGAAPG